MTTSPASSATRADASPPETSATADAPVVPPDAGHDAATIPATPQTAFRVPPAEAFWKGVARFQKLR